MKIEPITERHALPLEPCPVAYVCVGKILQEMPAKRICGKQTVIANVPPCRMTRIIRVLKDGNADSLSIHRTVIVTPASPLSPGSRLPLGVLGLGSGHAVIS